MNLDNETLRIIRTQKEHLKKMIREESNDEKQRQYAFERMLLTQEEDKILKRIDLE
ncbi:MAG: hypothetical protein IJH63_03280 [Methanobrevibacter sp.]|nr:hypothetical protein [Methanobrevibacter sp.]